MTEPEQWAVELCETLTRLAEANQDYLMEVAIQRAFEERERKLREALAPFAKYADGIGHFGGCNSIFEMEFASSVVGTRRLTQADFERARQALKETPDAG